MEPFDLKTLLVKSWKDGFLQDDYTWDFDQKHREEIMPDAFIKSVTAEKVEHMPEFWFLDYGIRAWLVRSNKAPDDKAHIVPIDPHNYVIVVRPNWNEEENLSDVIKAVYQRQTALMGFDEDTEVN